MFFFIFFYLQDYILFIFIPRLVFKDLMIVKYLYKKNIVSKSNGKFDSVTDHLAIGYTYVIYYDVCYRQIYIGGKKVPVLSNLSL